MSAERSDTKTSKLLACDTFGEPYAKLKAYPDTKTGQGYTLVFENNDTGIIDSFIPEANGPNSHGHPLVVGQEYRYQTYKSPRGTLMVDVLAPTNVTAQDIAKAIPGVTTAAALPAKEVKQDMSMPPSMREPVRTQEQVLADSKVPTPPQLPDNKPRTGVVKSITTNAKDNWPIDGKVLCKYAVVMEDGTVGNMWIEDGLSAPKQGSAITYTLDHLNSKGVAYKDGVKRIDIVPEGSSVGKELMIMRMACVNSAIALLAIPTNLENPNYEPTLENTLSIARQLEAHVTRSND